MSPESTPSQTVGPYFSIGLPWPGGPLAVPEGAPGALRVWGFVLDGAGEPVPDAMVETWQAGPDGRFADLYDDDGDPPAVAGFRGFARAGADDDGRYEVVTLKPGPVEAPGGGRQAPHIAVSVFARGLLHRCVTRIYFADEAQANAADAVLAGVPAARRGTLLAEPAEGGYRFDIHLQGPRETVFFDV